jgi:hypothetical protein
MVFSLRHSFEQVQSHRSSGRTFDSREGLEQPLGFRGRLDNCLPQPRPIGHPARRFKASIVRKQKAGAHIQKFRAFEQLLGAHPHKSQFPLLDLADRHVERSCELFDRKPKLDAPRAKSSAYLLVDRCGEFHFEPPMIELGANAWYFLKVLGVVFHTYSSPSEADHRAKARNCGNELCRHNSATRAAFPPTARILRADFETGCFNRFLRQLYRLLSIRRSTPSAQRSGPRVTFEMRLEAGYRFFARPPPVLYGHVRMAQSPEFYRDADFPGRCGEGTRGVWDLWPIDEECGMRRIARDHRDALWAHVRVEPSLSTSEFAQRLPDDPPARGGGRH